MTPTRPFIPVSTRAPGWRTRRALCAALVLCTSAGALESRAWTARTRIQMVDDAVRLMPESLRLVLERHRKAVLQGAIEPLAEEDAAPHRPSWLGGTLEAEIPARAAALVGAVETAQPIEVIARRFGELAHFVADAGFPPGVGDADDTARYRHFASLVETRRPKIPLVFYGWRGTPASLEAFAGFGASILERARSEDRRLLEAYRAAGNPPRASAFDDRSVPFALASLGYSHAVTDIARAWLGAWRAANGDLARTPYLRRKDLEPESGDDAP